MKTYIKRAEAPRYRQYQINRDNPFFTFSRDTQADHPHPEPLFFEGNKGESSTNTDKMTELSKQPIEVLIADDHNLILEIVTLALEDAADIKLTTANSVAEVDNLLSLHGPYDLILLDLDMPGMSGTQTVRHVLAQNNNQPVGLFTGGPTAQVIAELRGLGGVGIVPKSCSMRSLSEAIRIMATGTPYYDLVADLMAEDSPNTRYPH